MTPPSSRESREIRDRLGVIDAQLAVSDQPDPLAEYRDAPARAVWMPRRCRVSGRLSACLWT